MMKLLAILAPLVLGLSAFCAIPAPVRAAKSTSHVVEFKAPFVDDKVCTATAIGHQALLTATHCETPVDTVLIDGKTAVIVQRIRDSHDHTILLLQNEHFETFSQVDLSPTLAQGDDVFIWGNPGDWPDQFRKGYIAGRTEAHVADLLSESIPAQVQYDMNCWPGDSGAGVFDERGEVIAVLSALMYQNDAARGISIRMSMSYDLTFSSNDVDRAKAWAIADTVKEPHGD